jgi:dihydrofolate reductase
MAADLVDELLLTIEPIVLGGGKTIWSDNDQALEWELVSTAKAKPGPRSAATPASAERGNPGRWGRLVGVLDRLTPRTSSLRP